MSIVATPLGAGQDVGRSCILVSMGGKNIMLDCGMHMGYSDHRRFPNFRFLSRESEHFDKQIDLVLITHFHLDHCGALPHFTEVCGYNGPILMSYPTRAICPMLLEDYRKITVQRKGERQFYTSEDIANCMKKVKPMNIHEEVTIEPGFVVKAYYAGHVLGATMFSIKVGNLSVFYTGDFNMTPDRHLAAASVDRICPDLLITESTYATFVRDSKRAREQKFLQKIQACVEKGGNVLVPVFALGRAQELCLLVDTYWEQMGLGAIPVYFSRGLASMAHKFYKLFVNWTNESMKKMFFEHDRFDYKHVKEFDRSLINQPGPCIVFASPGMLHGGLSLEVFRNWCDNPNNMVVMPGYCVKGTVGQKVISGQKRIQLDTRTTLRVRLKVDNLKGLCLTRMAQVAYMSFSAHADAKGIMQLLQQAAPRHVMLVHGEKRKMVQFQKRVVNELGVSCSFPPNGTSVTVEGRKDVPVSVSSRVLQTSEQQAWTESLALQAATPACVRVAELFSRSAEVEASKGFAPSCAPGEESTTLEALVRTHVDHLQGAASTAVSSPPSAVVVPKDVKWTDRPTQGRGVALNGVVLMKNKRARLVHEEEVESLSGLRAHHVTGLLLRQLTIPSVLVPSLLVVPSVDAPPSKRLKIEDGSSVKLNEPDVDSVELDEPVVGSVKLEGAEAVKPEVKEAECVRVKRQWAFEGNSIASLGDSNSTEASPLAHITCSLSLDLAVENENKPTSDERLDQFLHRKVVSAVWEVWPQTNPPSAAVAAHAILCTLLGRILRAAHHRFCETKHNSFTAFSRGVHIVVASDRAHHVAVNSPRPVEFHVRVGPIWVCLHFPFPQFTTTVVPNVPNVPKVQRSSESNDLSAAGYHCSLLPCAVPYRDQVSHRLHVALQWPHEVRVAFTCFDLSGPQHGSWAHTLLKGDDD